MRYFIIRSPFSLFNFEFRWECVCLFIILNSLVIMRGKRISICNAHAFSVLSCAFLSSASRQTDYFHFAAFSSANGNGNLLAAIMHARSAHVPRDDRFACADTHRRDPLGRQRRRARAISQRARRALPAAAVQKCFPARRARRIGFRVRKIDLLFASHSAMCRRSASQRPR